MNSVSPPDPPLPSAALGGDRRCFGLTPPRILICCTRGCTLLEIPCQPVIILNPGQIAALAQHDARNHGP